MKTRPWSKVPAWWVSGDAERRLAALYAVRGYVGESIAALRVMVAVATTSDGHSSFECRMTMPELAQATSLSLPMVRRGVRLAANFGWLSHFRGGGAQTSWFGLVQKPAKSGGPGGFFQFPHSELSRFRGLPKRGHGVAVGAHQLYIYLLAMRPNGGREVAVSYRQISIGAGISLANIRRSISTIVNAGLVDVNREPRNVGESIPNIYRLRGNFTNGAPVV